MHRSPRTSRTTVAYLSRRIAIAATTALAVAALPATMAGASQTTRPDVPPNAHHSLPAGGLGTADFHPNAGGSILLKGVKAISPDDVWSVGYKIVGSVWSPVVRHWDGQ